MLTKAIHKLLSQPTIYRVSQYVLSRSGLPTYLRDVVRVQPKDRILDIGCGPAHVLESLPESCTYVGIDISASYIQQAKDRFGSRGTFICSSISESIEIEPASFDLVLATGVLHHLDDSESERLLRLARQSLAPSGRFVSVDPCFEEHQSRIARWFLSRDRGEFVRMPDAYMNLVSKVFDRADLIVRRDFLRVPYSHAVIEARV